MCSKVELQMPEQQEGQAFSLNAVSHYLAHIEIIRYSLKRNVSANFVSKGKAFFMYATEQENSCFLCYHPGGNEAQLLPPGDNTRLMVITFKPDWLLYKSQSISQLQPIVSLYETCSPNYIRFPAAGTAGILFKAHEKILDTGLFEDDKLYIFVNGCINKYYKNLASRNSTTAYHQCKADAVAHFINQNFTTSLVDDFSEMARRFLLSERNLARIAKKAFGVPLHEHVIKLRMQFSLQQLNTTSKPIFEIAREAGYQEPHYFSKAFKKVVGVPPSHVPRPCHKSALPAASGKIRPRSS